MTAAGLELQLVDVGPRKRIALDAYETPEWVPDQAWEDCISCLPGGHWIEPGAGHGHFIRAINRRRRDVTWTAVELRSECRLALEELGCANVLTEDFLEMGPPSAPYDVAIGNPPFTLAREWVDWCRQIAKRTVLLLRMGVLESEERVEWLRSGVTPERVFVLPHRPKFAHGKTDSCVYAFMQWGQGHNTRAELSVLPAWPAELRGRAARKGVTP